jgi:uncharacterized protein YjiS (DUF1127 family)
MFAHRILRAVIPGLPERLDPRRALAAPVRILGWYDRHLQRRHLSQLDAHLLHDLGLTKEEVVRECRKLF